MRYTNDILLLHEPLHGASAIHKQCSILVPHTLQSRALKDHVAFVPNCTLVTQQTQALGPRGASAAALNHWQTVGTHTEAQQNTHATSTGERLQVAKTQSCYTRFCCPNSGHILGRRTAQLPGNPAKLPCDHFHR